MKIERFNENSENSDLKNRILSENNRKRYLVKKSGGLAAVIHRQIPFNNLEEAIKKYSELKSEESGNSYVYIIEETKRVIPEEEIEFIITTNKYNL